MSLYYIPNYKTSSPKELFVGNVTATASLPPCQGRVNDDSFSAFESIYRQTNYSRFIVNLDSHVLNTKDIGYTIFKIIQPFFAFKDRTVSLVITHDGKKLQQIADAVHTMHKVQEARLLSMLPPNIGYPMRMAREIQSIFYKCKGVRVKVLNAEALKRMGMNLILSVGGSAVNKPCVVIVERPGSKNKQSKTVCIAGKGITFDSGGLALKPLSGMVDMKYDKIGAVYGVYALRELVDDVNLNGHTLVGVFPFAENVVSGSSTRPGDVVKSYSGKTVEIVNPDAEGRLILADALSFACDTYKPDIIIDIATLTGNAGAVNCFQTAYYYASNAKVRELVYNVGDETRELMNPMPPWMEYAYQLKSTVADIKNANLDLKCESFIATLFLWSFVPSDTTWVHFDLSNAVVKGIPTGKGIIAVVTMLKKYLSTKK